MDDLTERLRLVIRRPLVKRHADDLVERLREFVIGRPLYHPPLVREAADEIERLRDFVVEAAWEIKRLRESDRLRRMCEIDLMLADDDPAGDRLRVILSHRGRGP
jgi:hypothetical protein